MKSTDIALIILIAAISIVAAYFVGNAVLGDPYDKVEQMTYVKEVTSDVVEPDGEVFNPYNVNPTQEVYVGRCNIGEVWNPNSKSCVPFGKVDGVIDPEPDKPDEPDDKPEEKPVNRPDED